MGKKKSKQLPAVKSKEDLANELVVEKLLPEINANHRECIKSGSDAIQYAIQAGELLLRLKGSVKHGEWLPLLEKRVDCTPRAAQNYMKIVGFKATLQKQGKDVSSDATIGGCLKMIGQSKQSSKPPKSNTNGVRISPNTGGSSSSKPSPPAAVEPPQSEPIQAPAAKETAVKPTGPCPHGGEHDYDDEACRRCHDPKPKGRKISGGITFERAELEGDSKDAFGGEAPDELKKVFELCEGFKDQRSKLASIKTWMTQNQNHPGAVVLTGAANRIRTDINQADEELKFAAPYCVCVYCHNKPPKVANCNACKGLGWITEPIYKAAPKGMQRVKATA
jgi:hypothetical protein